MAKSSHLPLAPLLLALLVSGSLGAKVEPEELRAVVGQTLSVRCQYKPKTGPYVPKTWCQETSPDRCTRVVTTAQPRTVAEEQRHTIWDDPAAGSFIVNVTQLKETDSAPYWCGHYNASHRMVTILRNISLVVSLAWPTLPSPTSTWLPTRTAFASFPTRIITFLPTRTALITSTEETFVPSTNGTEHRNESSPFPLGWTSPGLLGSVQYGLLLLKGLALSVLCVILCCRRCQGPKYTADTVMMEDCEYSSLDEASKFSNTFGHVSLHRKNTYSPPPALPNH